MNKLVLTLLPAIFLNSCGAFNKKDNNSGEEERTRLGLPVEDSTFVAPVLEFEANKIYGKIPLVKDSEKKGVRNCKVVYGKLPNGFHLSDQCEIYGLYRENEDFAESKIQIEFSSNYADYFISLRLSVSH